MVAILGYSRPQILAAVQQMYEAVAATPDAPFHFPVGAEACRRLGYPAAQIDALPEETLARFAGVGYPFRAGAVRPGDRVLDIGAGAGNDALIARRLAGSGGRVIALDLTAGMTRRLAGAAGRAGIDDLDILQASWRRVQRRGLAGLAALGLALLSCYGTLALAALLPLLGIGLALDEGLWAGAIALFVLLTLAALAAGIRRHRGLFPMLLGVAGGGLVLHALFVDYRALVELAGFVLVGAAVAWDLRRRRRQEARVLGLETRHHG